MYTYKASLMRVVDGDTCDLAVDVGFHMTATLRFRLLGIDTPEVRGTTKEAGLAAKAALEGLLAKGPLLIRTEKGDSFGRWLADISVGVGDATFDVATEMLRLGHAVPYEGK